MLQYSGIIINLSAVYQLAYFRTNGNSREGKDIFFLWLKLPLSIGCTK